MKSEREEALEAVDKINDELSQKYSHDSLPLLSITFAANYTFIKLSPASKIDLPEFYIWSSIEDDRIYYDETDEYESFYKMIKRKFKVIKKEINSIKL